MPSKVIGGSCWSTSSFPDPADSASMELSALGEHLHHCKGRGGRLFALRCGAEWLHGVASARLVTSLVLLAALGGALLLLL